MERYTSDGGSLKKTSSKKDDYEYNKRFYLSYRNGLFDEKKITDDGWKKLYTFGLENGYDKPEDIGYLNLKKYGIDPTIYNSKNQTQESSFELPSVNPEVEEEEEKSTLGNMLRSIFSPRDEQTKAYDDLERRDRLNPVTEGSLKQPSLDVSFGKLDTNGVKDKDPLMMSLYNKYDLNKDTSFLGQPTKDFISQKNREIFNNQRDEQDKIDGNYSNNIIGKAVVPEPLKGFEDRRSGDLNEKQQAVLGGIQSAYRELIGKSADKAMDLPNKMTSNLANQLPEDSPNKEVVTNIANKNQEQAEYWTEDRLYNAFLGKNPDSEITDGQQIGRAVGGFAGNLGKLILFSTVLGSPATAKGLLAKNAGMGALVGGEKAIQEDAEIEDVIKSALIGAGAYGVGELAGIGVTNKLMKSLIHTYKANPTWATSLNALVRSARGFADGTVGGLTYAGLSNAMGYENEAGMKEAIQSGLLMGIVGGLTAYVPWDKFGITSDKDLKQFNLKVEEIIDEEALIKNGFIRLGNMEGVNKNNPYADDFWINPQTKEIMVSAVRKNGVLVPKSMVDGTSDADYLETTRAIENTLIKTNVDPTKQIDYVDKTKNPTQYNKLLDSFMERKGFIKTTENGQTVYTIRDKLNSFEGNWRTLSKTDAEKQFDSEYFTSSQYSKVGTIDINEGRTQKSTLGRFDDSYEVNRSATGEGSRQWVRDIQKEGYKEFKPGIWVKEVDGKITDIVPEMSLGNKGDAIPVFNIKDVNENTSRVFVSGLFGKKYDLDNIVYKKNPYIQHDTLDSFIKGENKDSFEDFKGLIKGIDNTVERINDALSQKSGKDYFIKSTTKGKLYDVNTEALKEVTNKEIIESVEFLNKFLDNKNVKEVVEYLNSVFTANPDEVNKDELQEKIKEFDNLYYDIFINQFAEVDETDLFEEDIVDVVEEEVEDTNVTDEDVEEIIDLISSDEKTLNESLKGVQLKDNKKISEMSDEELNLIMAQLKDKKEEIRISQTGNTEENVVIGTPMEDVNQNIKLIQDEIDNRRKTPSQEADTQEIQAQGEVIIDQEVKDAVSKPQSHQIDVEGNVVDMESNIEDSIQKVGKKDYETIKTYNDTYNKVLDEMINSVSDLTGFEGILDYDMEDKATPQYLLNKAKEELQTFNSDEHENGRMLSSDDSNEVATARRNKAQLERFIKRFEKKVDSLNKSQQDLGIQRENLSDFNIDNYNDIESKTVNTELESREYTIPNEIYPNKNSPSTERHLEYAHKELNKQLNGFSKELAKSLGLEHETVTKGKKTVNVFSNIGWKYGTIKLYKPNSDIGVYINIRYDEGEGLGKEYNWNYSLKLDSSGPGAVLYRTTKKGGNTNQDGLNNFYTPKDGIIKASELGPLIKKLLNLEETYAPTTESTQQKEPTEAKKPETKQEETKKEETNNRDNIKSNIPEEHRGYHAGDLGKAHDTAFSSIISSNRSTGHFGHGTYFVGDKEKINLGSHKNRPMHIVDFRDYNLFKPKDLASGELAHRMLKFVNYNYRDIEVLENIIDNDIDDYETYKTMFDGEIDIFYDEEDWNKNFIGSELQERALNIIENTYWLTNYQREDLEYLPERKNDIFYYRDALDIMKRNHDNYVYYNLYDYKEFKKEVENIFGISYEEAKKVLSNVTKAIDGGLGKSRDSNYFNKSKTFDSPSTIFMKELGYEGIDVRHIKQLDNTTYGSVIYDLKTTTDSGDKKEAPKEVEAVDEEVIVSTDETTINARDILSQDYGINVVETETNKGNPIYNVTGNTKDFKDILGRQGMKGLWYGPKKAWSFKPNQFKTIDDLADEIYKRISALEKPEKQTIEGIDNSILDRVVEAIAEQGPDDWQGTLPKQRMVRGIIDRITKNPKDTTKIFDYLMGMRDRLPTKTQETQTTTQATQPTVNPDDVPDIFFRDVLKSLRKDIINIAGKEGYDDIDDMTEELGLVNNFATNVVQRDFLIGVLERLDDIDEGEIEQLFDLFENKIRSLVGEIVQVTESVESTKSINHGPSQEIANKVVERLNNNNKLTYVELFDIADKAYNGTQANNDYNVKDAYDGLELGVNQYLLQDSEMLKVLTSTNGAIKNVQKIENMMKLIPTQTKRTKEMEDYQQFSTPPNIAYVANWLANINENDVMLEPSAGIGGIAVFSKAMGAEVIVNELSERRLEILKNMGFDRYFNENAEQLDNILPDDVQPTVVVMNPPFSATAGRMDKNKTKYATLHIEQALARLPENGRLVAIVGHTMGEDFPQFRQWWKEIKSKYMVWANVTVDGKNYTKYGTSYDINIFVIDKLSPIGYTTNTGKYESLEDLIKDLEVVRNARQKVVPSNTSIQQEQGQSNVREDDRENQNTSGRGKSSSTTTHGVGNRKPTNEGNVEGITSTSNVQSNQQDTNVNNENNDTRGSVDRPTSTENIQNTGTDVNVSTRNIDGESRNVEDVPNGIEVKVNKNVKKVDKDEDIDKVFSDYQPQKLKIKGAKPHKGKLSESTAMGAVQPPDPTYKPSLPQELIDSGDLSDAQLEVIVYAGQSHEQMLPNNTRRGFFIGDGTGVGKGREISGIILDNYNKGRKKAVWVSKNIDLYKDAQRDLLGVGHNPELAFKPPKPGEKIPNKEGILFIPYLTLASGIHSSMYNKQIKRGNSSNNTKKARLDQIVEWLGPDFDGVIAFDESHRMANAMGSSGARGKGKASDTAISGIALQEALPNARVVYVSATGATEVENLAYLTRLGLWGEETSFPSVNEFVSSIGSGGLASMELVAREMKSQGLYLSRGLSYDDVTYERIEHILTPEQRQAYDAMARAWQIVMQNMEKALEITKTKNTGNARGQFWGSQQRFFNQILTAMSMPSVLRSIDKNIKDGYSVVIQLTNTNESLQKRRLADALENDIALEDIDMSPKDMIIQYLQNTYPVQQNEEFVDEDGKKRVRPVVDSQGNPVLNKEAVRDRDRMIAMLGSINMPESPLDMIINKFGPKNVAEVTGRSKRIVRTTDSRGNEKVELEKRTEDTKSAEVNDFANDKRQVLVFSEAGGTGKSYHASLDYKNQRRRMHYILQAGFNAMSAMQGLGRTHRTNQASAPHVMLVTTDIAGHKRFISTIARRLDQLGALTKGQRQAGTQGLFGEKDNLEGPIAREALYEFYKRLGRNGILGLDRDDVLTKMGLYQYLINENGRLVSDSDVFTDVRKFLNRLLVLEPDMQDSVFNAYADILDYAVEKAIESGTLDVGLENVKADSINVFQEQVIRKDEKTGAETTYVEFDVKKKVDVNKFEDVNVESQHFHGFYKNTRSGIIRAYFVSRSVTNEDGTIERSYRTIEPEAHKTQRVSESDMKRGNLEKVELKEAEELWNNQLSDVPEYKEGSMHLITGSILPIWSSMDFYDEKVRVVRVITDDGREYLGRLMKKDNALYLLRKLGQQVKVRETSLQDKIDSVIKSDKIIVLANGWRVKRSRVSGDYRLELIGPDINSFNMLTDMGLFSEVINYNTRWFIPTKEAESILQRLTKTFPISSVRDSSNPNRNFRSKNNQKNGTLEEKDNLRKTNEQIFFEKSNEKPKPLADIIKDIKDKFEISISSKRFVRTKGSIGQYQEHSHSIRVHKNQDIDVIAHELGHHLDNLYKFSDKFEGHLMSIADTLDLSDSYSDEEIPGEVFAEFIRLYLTTNEEAQELSSVIYDAFMEDLSVGDLKKINDIRADLLKWLASSATEQIESTIVSYTDKKKFSIDDEKTRQAMYWFNDVQPIEDLTNYVEATGGEKLRYQDNPMVLIFQSRSSEVMTKTNMTTYMTDIEGNPIDLSFTQILESISKDETREFDSYLKTRHALTLAEFDKQVFADRITLDTQKLAVQDYEARYPHFVETAEKLYKWWGKFVKEWVVKSGFLSDRAWLDLQARYPTYVPNFRVMEDKKGTSTNKAKSGYVNQHSPIKHMKGNDLPTYSVIESLVLYMDKIIKTQKRNEVGLAIHNLYHRFEGLGDVITEIRHETELNRINAVPLKAKLVKRLADAYIEQMNPSDKAIAKQFTKENNYEGMLDFIVDRGFMGAEIVDESLNDIINFFTPRMFSTDKNVYTIMDKEGKTHFYEVHDELLLKALLNVSPPQLDGTLKLIGSIRRIQSNLITSGNPVFGLLTNIVADTPEAYIYGAYGNPVEFAKELLKSIISVVTKDDTLKQYRAMGGGFSSRLSDNRQVMTEIMNELFPDKKKDSIKSLVNYSLGLIEQFNEAIESGPRLTEYKKYIKEYGDTYEGRLMAIYHANDVTTNFKRRGMVVYTTIGQGTHFLNAGIQGLSKFHKEFIGLKGVGKNDVSAGGDGKKKKDLAKLRATLIKALMSITMFEIISMMAYRDDEDYKKLSTYIKDNFWLIKYDEGKFIRIKKPRAVAVVFGATFRRAYDSLVKQDPEAWDNFMMTVQNIVLPPNPINDNIFMPGISIYSNKSWSGSPIVPLRLQGLPGSEQFTTTTSEITKAVTRVLSDKVGVEVSPMYLDYLIKQTTGIVGEILLPATAEGTTVSDAMKKKVVSDVAFSNNAVNNFYERKEKLDKSYTLYNKEGKKNKDFDPVERYRYYQVGQEVSALYSQINKVKESGLPLKEIQAIERDLRLKILELTQPENLKPTAFDEFRVIYNRGQDLTSAYKKHYEETGTRASITDDEAMLLTLYNVPTSSGKSILASTEYQVSQINKRIKQVESSNLSESNKKSSIAKLEKSKEQITKGFMDFYKKNYDIPIENYFK